MWGFYANLSEPLLIRHTWCSRALLGVMGLFRGANRTNFQPRIFILTITHLSLTHPNLDAFLYTSTNGKWKLNVV